tara:strand:+ start:277 stop:714 length:438 start_codon:yes stop_codon:yes gene_type:complete
MYLPDKDGFYIVGKRGRHKYSYPINRPEKKFRLALPAWVKIKELIGVYKITNRKTQNIHRISKLSSMTIETAMRDSNLLNYSPDICLSKCWIINYKKNFLHLIANGCKNQKLYELLNIATIKLEQRLFKKKANLQKFKKIYLTKV